MANLDVKQFNYMAWLTGIAVLVLLGGAVWALLTGQISFEVFASTVGTPVSAVVGWWARGAVVRE